MRGIVSLVFILFVLSRINAQQGSPLLTNYTESRDIENQNWAICQDDNQVMLFANRKGITTFDGEEWLSIRIPTIPYTLKKNPVTGKIFIGGDNNYGFLEKDLSGSYKYVSLSEDSARTGIITKIIFTDSLVWFYGEQTISRFNLETNRLELRLNPKSGSLFSGMFTTPKNTFINMTNSGLYRLESDTLFPIVTGFMTENLDILFSMPFNKNLVLVGLSNGTLSLFDGIKYYDYLVKDEGYLKENILSEGIPIGDTAYAFSTLDGGAVVIEKMGGKVLFTINNQNELPDDEIFAIGSDNSGGLWLSHQYGLTRADLSLPISNYTVFPGLKGNISAALMDNNRLFVATSEGVFYLAEVKNYAEVEVLVKNIPAFSPASGTEEDNNRLLQKGRKGIFARIFGKKTSPQQPEKGGQNITDGKPEEKYTRKTVNKVRSINYFYRKVDGLNEKCRQLVSTPHGILAATNKGVYVINNGKALLVASNHYINHINWTPFNGRYFIASSDGYLSLRYQDGKWISEQPDPEFFNPVYSVFQTDAETLWLGGDDVACRALIDKNGFKYFTYKVREDFPVRYNLDLINDSVFLFTESAIHYYSSVTDSFEPYKRVAFSPADENIVLPLSNLLLMRSDDEWLSLDPDPVIGKKELSLLKVFDDLVSVMVEDKYIWIVGGENKLFGIDRKRSSGINPAIDVFIKSFSNDRGTKFDLQNVEFDRGDNIINFNIVAPGYLKQSTTQYQYFINKIMSGWSPWSARTHYEKTVRRPGDYVLQVRAKDLWGNIGSPKSIKFTIKAPFTQTVFFWLIVGFAVFLLFISIVRIRERQLQTKNRLLEEKVKERTAEIEAQKEEITASIEYASRIQRAMLPMEEHFNELFDDHFILFKPRDIVSGDFYWIGEDEKNIYFTVADCTGHGVPGAFMSTMGISTLNEIISNNHNLRANEILNILRQKIMKALHQTGKIGEAADGLDISFCILNKSGKELQYSGAYNPLLIFQAGELKEYKADRMPIGIHYGTEMSFTNYVLKVSKGDTLYLFSDGFNDQFGGPEGAKYKKSNLKKLLTEIYYRPMVEQYNILEGELAGWKGNNEQIDDITIIGIKI